MTKEQIYEHVYRKNCHVLSGAGLASLPPCFTLLSLHPRLPQPQIKCRTTLRISGLLPSAYWCGQAAVDIPFYYLILSCMCITLFSLHTEKLLTSSNLSALVSLLFIYIFHWLSVLNVRMAESCLNVSRLTDPL